MLIYFLIFFWSTNMFVHVKSFDVHENTRLLLTVLSSHATVVVYTIFILSTYVLLPAHENNLKKIKFNNTRCHVYFRNMNAINGFVVYVSICLHWFVLVRKYNFRLYLYHYLLTQIISCMNLGCSVTVHESLKKWHTYCVFIVRRADYYFKIEFKDVHYFMPSHKSVCHWNYS